MVLSIVSFEPTVFCLSSFLTLLSILFLTLLLTLFLTFIVTTVVYDDATFTLY